jgi:hypothetical protein
MHDPVTPTSSVRRIAETAVAAGVIVLRLFRTAPEELWRDWMLILAVYWIFTVWGRRGRLWPAVTLVVMSLLLSVYLHGSLGHTLGTLGLAR